MKKASCVSALVLVLSGISYAAPIMFTGLLSGANENPANSSPGNGNATVIYDPTTQMLSVDVIFSGLEADTTASHIHCCVAPGGNAGVATALPSFPGFPLGVTSGSYTNTFDLTLASSFNPAFVTANGGTIAGGQAALVTGLENGMAYLNIHTGTFPNGEVRAFLEPVPEPRSIVLSIAALVGLLARRRKLAV